MDFAVLRIERSWGQVPGWFDGLDREQQVRLLAMDRIEMEPVAPTPLRRGRT
jgi:hypothetical protein